MTLEGGLNPAGKLSTCQVQWGLCGQREKQTSFNRTIFPWLLTLRLQKLKPNCPGRKQQVPLKKKWQSKTILKTNQKKCLFCILSLHVCLCVTVLHLSVSLSCFISAVMCCYNILNLCLAGSSSVNTRQRQTSWTRLSTQTLITSYIQSQQWHFGRLLPKSLIRSFCVFKYLTF